MRRKVHGKLKRQTAALLHGHCTVSVADPETWVNTEFTMMFIVAVISAEAWPVPAVQAASPPIRSIRISAALHNDAADIDRLVAALGELSAGGIAAG